jgi:PAS domain S-box-containing protein
VPFILFTGKGNEAVAGEAISVGVTDYLRKSTDTEQYGLLADRITNAVEGSRTERKLVAEQRRFQVLFEQFPEPTLAYVYEDDEPHIAAVNEAFTEVFGFDAETTVGEPVDDLLVPPDRREEADRIDERVRAGDPVDEHLRRRTADGLRDFRFRNVQLPDDDPVDGYAIYADITERLSRERELERRNDLFRRAQDLADVGAWAYDPAADELAWTEAVYDIYGVSPSFEPTLEAALSFYHPDDRDAVGMAVDRTIADGDRFEVEARIVTEDGAVRWVRTHGSPLVEDGEVVRIRGAVQDVTDRKAQLETISELQHSGQRLIRARDPERVGEIAVDISTAALELPYAGVFRADLDEGALDPVAFSEAGQDRLGDAPTFHRNAPDRTLDRLLWGVFEAGEPAIVDNLGDRDAVDAGETPASSGVAFPLGEHGIFVAAAPDPHTISETDRYLADILATVLTATLDRTDRERALREQKELLEDRTERLDELVSVISHDLQSPLNVADGRLELARTDCDSRHLEDAASAVDRSSAIVEDLLALGREGDRGGERTAVALASLAQDCWVSVISGRATLEAETDRHVRADRGRLRHLLENLFRNAVEHGSTSPPSHAQEDAVEHGSTSPGSRTREDAAEHEPPDDGSVTVVVGDLADGFYVADDGVGIPPAKREEVFESGYSSGDGTGLGLSIVRQVAREHGWDVALTESDAGGARFEFTGVESTGR